jgi:mRNA-degrading endonuclease RelE of RelBE toxin-antitoxin system
MSYDELIKLESIKQNNFSPGVVIDEEEIARVIFSPIHYDNGKILPTAFEQVLYKQQGMSVLRLGHDFNNSLEKTIEQLQKSGINNYIGYVSASVHDIRKIRYKDYRLFYILDTATSNKKGHADIIAIRPHDKISLPKKALKNYIRKEISEVFKKSYIVKDVN